MYLIKTPGGVKEWIFGRFIYMRKGVIRPITWLVTILRWYERRVGLK